MNTKKITLHSAATVRPGFHRLGIAALGLLWLAIVFGGLVALGRYEFSPGNDAAAPARWPDGSGIPRGSEEPTLVVFAHPRCPCTAATLEELAEIVATTGVRASVNVIFFNPADAGLDWTHTTTVLRAAEISSVTVQIDKDGVEARRFHAATSGRTLLYSAAGELLFDGGITGSRGHVGKNAGSAALVALLTRPSGARATAPVFGCAILQDPNVGDCFKCKR
jgi:hypothetical protein